MTLSERAGAQTLKQDFGQEGSKAQAMKFESHPKLFVTLATNAKTQPREAPKPGHNAFSPEESLTSNYNCAMHIVVAI